MKTRNIKKLIVGLAFIAVAAIAAWNVSINSNENGLSDVSLANVEALAREPDVLQCYDTKLHICCCNRWEDPINGGCPCGW